MEQRSRLLRGREGFVPRLVCATSGSSGVQKGGWDGMEISACGYARSEPPTRHSPLFLLLRYDRVENKTPILIQQGTGQGDRVEGKERGRGKRGGQAV